MHAIERGDADTAEAAMRRHIGVVRGAVDRLKQAAPGPEEAPRQGPHQARLTRLPLRVGRLPRYCMQCPPRRRATVSSRLVGQSDRKGVLRSPNRAKVSWRSHDGWGSFLGAVPHPSRLRRATLAGLGTDLCAFRLADDARLRANPIEQDRHEPCFLKGDCEWTEKLDDVGDESPPLPADDRSGRFRRRLAGAWPLAARAAEDLTIGIVYVGARDDFGWNQAHAVGVKALRELPNVKVVEEENVPETDAVSKTMESMINLDGAKLILPTSFGYYSPFVVEEAKQNPEVQFRHAAPLWKPRARTPRTPASYFAFLDQGHYIDGVAAGALHSKTGKLGFVAAKPIAHRAAQHQFLPDRRPHGQSGRHRAGDLHRRVVAAGARGGSHQRAGRCRLRSSSPATSTDPRW